MKRHLKRKQFELLHNALGVKAAELANVEDSFHQGKQCSMHAQMQSTQIWVSSFSLQINTSGSGNVSFFSSSHGLSIGVTHTINLKIEKFDISIFTSKHMEKKHKSPEIVLTSLFTWLLTNMNPKPLNSSLCQISWFPPTWNNFIQNRAVNLWTIWSMSSV